VAAAELARKLEEEEKRREQKKKQDVFAPENWDSLLADEFDGGLGESYGVLLVSKATAYSTTGTNNMRADEPYHFVTTPLQNKYAVVPLHFLLVTRHWEHQTAPLTPPQLTAAYQLLSLFASTMPHPTPLSCSRAATQTLGSATNPLVGGELLCFFNCGEASGASQEHKHLQFAPMTGEGSIGFFPVERAAQAASASNSSQPDKPFSLDALPYAHHIRRLDPPPCPSADAATPDQLLPLMSYLQEAYLSLLDAMVDNLRLLHDSDPETVPADQLKLGRGLSYNLLMTRKHMHMIPRRAATFVITTTEPKHATQEGASSNEADGISEGLLSPASAKATKEPVLIGCNSLAYTGTVLVKSADDGKQLEKRGGVLEALKHCGYPKSTRTMPNINHDEQELQL
jgi:ATP adenylyltransferase